MSDKGAVREEPLQFARTFVTGPDFPRRLARAQFRYTLLRTYRIVPFGITLGVLLIVAIIATIYHLPDWPGIIIPLAVATLILLPFSIAYPISVRLLRARLPAGSEFSIGFRSHTFVVVSPLVSGEVAYAAYQSCERELDFAVLKRRGTRIVRLLPMELFTAESFEDFAMRVKRAT